MAAAAAEEIRVDAAKVAVLSQLDGFFHIKKKNIKQAFEDISG